MPYLLLVGDDGYQMMHWPIKWECSRAKDIVVLIDEINDRVESITIAKKA